MAKRRTRLARRTEKRSKKHIFLFIVGIFVVIYLAFRLGIPILANFSLFISQFGKEEEVNSVVDKSYIAPPVLNPLLVATNSARIVISGKAFEDQVISLYINDDLIGKTSTDEDGEFSFIEILDKGFNEIKVKAKMDKNESDFSKAQTVIFEDNAPELTIDTPEDGQSFNKVDRRITVSGKTDVNTDVTVNGSWAILNDVNQYEYTISLNDGENEITVVAIDQAGNRTEKSITVSYSP